MILYLDLSVSKVSTVQLRDGDQIVDELAGPNTLELIDHILAKNNLKLTDLEAVDAFPGPGSFTGLKVGAAIANTLNFALGKEKRVSPVFSAKT